MATKSAYEKVYVREIPVGSDKWYVETHFHGRRKAQKQDSKSAAIAYRRFIRRQMREGKFSFNEPVEQPSQPVNNDPIFSEYYEKTFKPNHIEKLKRASQKSYELSFDKCLINEFGTMKLSAISPARVNNFLSSLTKAGKAKNTIRVILSNARKMFNFAILRDEVTRNPFASQGESYKQAKEKKEIDYLRYEEVPMFMDSIRKHFPTFFDFFATALNIGAREGELKGLQWGDIQLGDEKTLMLEPFVIIRRSVDQSRRIKETKTGRIRSVPLNDELKALLRKRRARMLRNWIKSRRDECAFSDSWVFPNEAGRPLNGSNVKRRVFRPALEKAELRTINFHSLRHTFASILIQQGKPIAHVSKWLGHSSIKVTVDIYGHLEPNTNREALNVLPSFVSKGKGKKKAIQFG